MNIDTCEKVLCFLLSLAALGLSAYAVSNQYTSHGDSTV